MLTEKRLNIISRYNEDVLWSRHLHGRLIIYNKGETECYSGDKHKTDVEVRKAPNVGKDLETWFRAIYDNYDDLHNYDSVAVLQGEPFAHCKYLFNILDRNLEGAYSILASWTGCHATPTDDLIFKKHKHNIDKLMLYKNSKIESLDNIKCDVNDLSILGKQHIYMLDLLDIDYSHIKPIIWSCGTQYLVNTKLFLNKSKSWWKSSAEIIYYACDKIDNRKLESTYYALERIMPIIFRHSDKIGNLHF